MSKRQPTRPVGTRNTELIGMDTDGQMYLWSTGNVRPITAFEIVAGRYIKNAHYVIQWKGQAITVHCSGRCPSVIVQFMCNRGPVICMRQTEVEAMLLGEVVPDPELEARSARILKECNERIIAAQQAPHRRRGRVQ